MVFDPNSSQDPQGKLSIVSSTHGVRHQSTPVTRQQLLNVPRSMVVATVVTPKLPLAELLPSRRDTLAAGLANKRS